MEAKSPFSPEKLRPVPNVPMHEYVLEKIRQKLEESGDQIFVRDVFTGETVMYSEVEPLSRKLACALAKMGFKKHDVCLMVTRNHARVFICFLAIMRLNGTIFQCYPEDHSGTIANRLQLCKSKFVFCDSESAPEVLKSTNLVDWPVNAISMDSAAGCMTLSELFFNDGEDLPVVSFDVHKDAAVIFCTSGTTGLSKGAVISNHSCLFAILQDGLFSRNKGCVFISGKPFHVSGFTWVFGQTIRHCTTLTASKLTAELFFSTIDTHKPRTIFSFPTYLGWIISDPSSKKYDFSSVTFVITGGAPTFSSNAKALKESFPNMRVLNKVYGMSENLCLTSTCDLNSLETDDYVTYKDSESEGYLLPYATGRVIDITTGERQECNKPGEIFLKSPTTMLEYIGNPQETKEVLQDGWLKTGDYGYFDENGGIYILSRLKEVFKYWNNHVSPLELEGVILHHSSVLEVCVIGVKDPEGGGDIPRAVVVLKPGHNEVECEKTIKKFVADRMENYKQLRGGIIFVNELPRGNTGKMLRNQVLKQFSA